MVKKQKVEEKLEKSFVYGSLRALGHNRHVVEDLIDTLKDGTIKAQMFHYADEG